MKTVSYSQFSLYLQCPHRWKLDYVDGQRTYEQNINTCFGSAFHTTVQDYVQCLLTKSVKEADNKNLHEELKNNMFEEYRASLAKNDNQHYSTPQQLGEFWNDGIAILDYFKRHRTNFFNSKHHELVGIEKPLRMEVKNNVAFIGFIDIIIKDKRDGVYTIYDIKTSTQGWNKYQKADVSKTAQLILYKEYYAKQFDVDPDMIHVEYIIVRRKINEDLEFAPKRIQTFSPASGKPTRNKVSKMFDNFLTEGFKEDGTYNTEGSFPAYKGKSCNYCPYKENYELCPKEKRVEKNEEL